MSKFRIWFSARRKGAIGVWSSFVEDVEATTASEAIFKLYDEYEHISVGRVLLLEEQGV